jgi:long-chain acyl-CoA synthetase
VILEQVLRHAAETPGKPAIIANRRTWTYGELAAGVAEWRERLQRRIQRGTSVALAMTNDGEAAAALLAADLLGYPAVLLGRGLRPDEVRWAMRAGGTPVLLADPARALDPGLHIVVSEEAVSAGPGVYLLNLPGDTARVIWPGDSYFGQMTSGSTGPSRLAIRSRTSVMTEIAAVSRRLALTPEDHVVCSSAISHSYALIGGLLASLYSGATVTLASSPADLSWVESNSGPSILFGIAPTYQALFETGSAVDTPLRELRLLLSAGAPLPIGLFDAFHARFGLRIRQDYGTTETGTIAIDASTIVDPVTVGTPLPHLEIQLRSAEGGASEILVRSPSVSAGYLGPEGIEPCTDADGWHHTGDLGELRGELLSLKGRRRISVQVGGHTVDPGTVEEAMLRIPGMKDAAVVVVLDRYGSTALKALVVSNSLRDADVRACLAGALPAWYMPEIIEFRERLPRSPAGKLLRKYLD